MKKLVIFLLCVLLTASMIPLTASAASDNKDRFERDAVNAAVDALTLYALENGQLFDLLIGEESCVPHPENYPLLHELFESEILIGLPRSDDSCRENYLSFRPKYSSKEALNRLYARCFVDRTPDYGAVNEYSGEARFIYDSDGGSVASGVNFWGWNGHTFFDVGSAYTVQNSDGSVTVSIPRPNTDHPEESEQYIFRMVSDGNRYRAEGDPHVTPLYIAASNVSEPAPQTGDCTAICLFVACAASFFCVLALHSARGFFKKRRRGF